MRGAVLEVMPDGTCLVKLAIRPQTAYQDGDFVQVVLTQGQYEIIDSSVSGPQAWTCAGQSANEGD